MAMSREEAHKMLDEAPERIEMDPEIFERFVSIAESGLLGEVTFNRDAYGDVSEVQSGELRFGGAE